MLIGDVNRLAVLIGARGMGKSTWASHLVLRWQREMGAYVIGHSLGGRLPPVLPPALGGFKLPIEYHERIKDVRRGLYWHPERWHILAPKPGSSTGATADDLLHFAQDMSDAIRKRAWEAKPGNWRWRHSSNHHGVDAPPVIVDIDEGVAVEGAGVSRKDDNRWFLEFLASLRHMHIAMVWSQQDPTARSWRILEQATDLYVFREHHDWALNALRASGVTNEQIEQIRRMPEHHHLHIRPGSLDWLAAEKVARRDVILPVKSTQESTGRSAVGQEPAGKVKPQSA